MGKSFLKKAGDAVTAGHYAAFQGKAHATPANFIETGAAAGSGGFPGRAAGGIHAGIWRTPLVRRQGSPTIMVRKVRRISGRTAGQCRA
jgi:hypothetical protein